MIRLLACLSLILVTPSALAQGVFDVSGLDASMYYLGAVFGQMGTLPLSSEGSPLFANMLEIMNKIIFFLGVIVVIYTGLVSTVQTAQEGEVLGKKWSTIWIPVRAALGLFLLVPSAGTGYSYIQIFVMYLIVQGVGAANEIWERVLYYLSRGITIQSTVAATAGANAAKMDDIKKIMKSELCKEKINSDPELLATLDDEPVVFFRSRNSRGELTDKLIWGLESSNTQICGAITIPYPEFNNAIPRENLGSGVPSLSAEPLADLYTRTIESSSSTLEMIAQEVYSDPTGKDTWTTPANLSLVARTINNGFIDIATYYDSVRADSTNILDIAAEQGWIHAGGYYYLLVSNERDRGLSGDYTISYEEPRIKQKFGDDQEVSWNNEWKRQIADIWTQAAALLGSVPARQEMIADNWVNAGSGFLQPLSNALKELAVAILASMHGGHASAETPMIDPLVPISQTGQIIMTVIEAVFWVLLVAIPLISLVSMPPCINPVWGTVVTMALIIGTLFMLLGPLLFSAGVILGLYVPLIPFLVYTFSAIAWIILVIEAIVAAPLVALILVVPSEDEMGKAGHSLVILLGLIFRPALMVVGFILGAKTMFVVMNMLDFGFKSYILENLTGIGVFGAVAIIVIYCGVVSTVIHQCFSLIYAIPDKVLRWMGGQPETQDVMGKVEKIKGSAQKGAQVGGGLMKGGVGAGMSRLNKKAGVG